MANRHNKQKDNGITRREFLYGAAASIALAGGITVYRSYLAYEANRTQADRFFESFPDQIPGAASIEKFPTEGASHCLVHIQIVHGEPWFQIFEHYGADENSRITKESIMRSIENVQPIRRDTKKILEYLFRDQGIKSIYLEGYREKDPSSKEGIVKNFNLSMSELKRIQQLMNSPISKDEKEKLNKTSLPYYRYSTWALGNYGGALELIIDGKLKSKFGEIRRDDSLFDFSKNLEEKDKIRKGKGIDSPLLLKIREDELLELVSKSEDAIALTWYGGGHDFKDSIKEWNKSNPLDKFSFIRIKPDSYENVRLLTGKAEYKVQLKDGSIMTWSK